MRRALERLEEAASGGLPQSCRTDGDGDLIGDNRRSANGPMCTTEEWANDTSDECYQKALQLNRNDDNRHTYPYSGPPRSGQSCGDEIEQEYTDHTIRISPRDNHHKTRSEGGARSDISMMYTADASDTKPRTYTVFVEGSATRGTDYRLEILQGYKTGNYPSSSVERVYQEAPADNVFRITVRKPNSTIYAFRVIPLNDEVANEPDETVVLRLKDPTPKERVLHWDIRRGWQTQVFYQPEMDSFQPYTTGNLSRRSATINITDSTPVSNSARPTLTISDVVVQEGTFGEWKNSYITASGLNAQPAGYCFSGRLTRTPDRSRDFSLFGVTGKLVFCRDRRGTYYQNRYSPHHHPRKNAKVYAWKDLQDDTSESYTIGFVTEHVWTTSSSGQRRELPLSQGPTINTGTFLINNDGPLPKEWLARFGHAVASETADAVSDRARASRAPGQKEGSFGAIPTPDAEVDFGQLIHGASFSLTGEEQPNGTLVSAWGKVSSSSFDTNLDESSLDSDNTHAMLGVDVATERWMMGVGLGFHSGDGGANPVSDTSDRYEIESNLLSVFPYGSTTLGKTTVWATLGYGSDDIRLKRTGSQAENLGTTDTTWRMAALGFRSALSGGPAHWAIIGDALWSEIESDEAIHYRASQSSSRRQRLGIESTLQFETVSFTPGFFIRNDGGDVGDETNIELAADVAWQPTDGLLFSGSANRTLSSDNEFSSYSLGARYQTGKYGRPSVSWSPDGPYALGWSRKLLSFDNGTIGVLTEPDRNAIQLNLAVRF